MMMKPLPQPKECGVQLFYIVDSSSVAGGGWACFCPVRAATLFAGFLSHLGEFVTKPGVAVTPLSRHLTRENVHYGKNTSGVHS